MKNDGAFPADAMSLRDWFAGMALQGLLAESAHPKYLGSFGHFEQYVLDAYRLADAMLAERERGKNEA